MAAADPYDVIVVGARCAGSPTAMLLARQGYKVLVVDRATFPSDTLSTHVLHPPGVAALQRWGLLDRARRDRLPAARHVHVRLRVLHDLRCAGNRRCAGCVLPASHRARQVAGRRRRGGRRGGTRSVHARRGRDRRRARGRYPRPRARAATASRNARGSSSVPTGASRVSPRRSAPSSTTRSRRSCAGTTAIGAACPRRVGSTSTRDPSAGSPPHRRTTG